SEFGESAAEARKFGLRTSEFGESAAEVSGKEKFAYRLKKHPLRVLFLFYRKFLPIKQKRLYVPPQGK
ncbi:MAG: hypothetical protein IJA39_01450, partial [Clostridia bacterium]|nr:hypothetical protein [Clostridia bacterium]